MDIEGLPDQTAGQALPRWISSAATTQPSMYSVTTACEQEELLNKSAGNM